MTDMDRKIFLYGAAIHQGCKVDWETGRIIPPKGR